MPPDPTPPSTEPSPPQHEKPGGIGFIQLLGFGLLLLFILIMLVVIVRGLFLAG